MGWSSKPMGTGVVMQWMVAWGTKDFLFEVGPNSGRARRIGVLISALSSSLLHRAPVSNFNASCIELLDGLNQSNIQQAKKATLKGMGESHIFFIEKFGAISCG